MSEKQGPTEEAVAALLRKLKRYIDSDSRVDEEDTRAGMIVTFATNDEMDTWTFQTGDNSYTGDCYFLPHWAVTYLFRGSDCASLARDVVATLKEAATEKKGKERKSYV